MMRLKTVVCRELRRLPLPNGERVGVRGVGSLDRPEPLTPPLSQWEREQTEFASPWRPE
jgi:hypothetical protein